MFEFYDEIGLFGSGKIDLEVFEGVMLQLCCCKNNDIFSMSIKLCGQKNVSKPYESAEPDLLY